MNDLISRQAAIDALRYAQHRFTVADEAGGMGTVKWSENVIYFDAAVNALSLLPSAQPEIIRCKDCKYAEESDEREWLLCHWYGDQWNEEDHWCSHAERKEI